MKAYVINLLRARDRRRFMEEQLARVGLEHEFVEAVDGHALTGPELGGLDRVRWLTPGLIGAALSHREAYRRLVESGARRGIVLEDDAKLPYDLPRLVEPLATLATTDVALLHYRTEQPARLCLDAPLAKGFRLARPLDTKWLNAATAYLIGREAAERIAGLPKLYDPDGWGDLLAAGAIRNVWCVHPQPVSANASFKSTVGYADGSLVPGWAKTWNRKRIARRMTRFELVLPHVAHEGARIEIHGPARVVAEHDRHRVRGGHLPR